ncbi:MAG: protein kinase [Conexibacteraceae bacterium]|nr:protein kinase [Conexibacteraceae bacterium]
MSTVYRAHDETLERFVAVKLMNREVATDSDQLERFRREARAVARLSHPNIVHVIDAGEDEGRPFIVFEYVEGETLKQRIHRLGRLPIPEAVTYSIEVARALKAAHSHRVVHRDVKPQNVLIDHEGTAKVTDFGIARTLEEEGLTADGRVLGTTDYVSPEQALGHYVTGQSDLYSLGVALYEMLTGELPFTGETQVVVAMKHVRETVPDVRNGRPEVSPELATVVKTATSKNLAERYPGDAEMIAALERVLAIEAARADTGGADTVAADSQPTAEVSRIGAANGHAAGAESRAAGATSGDATKVLPPAPDEAGKARKAGSKAGKTYAARQARNPVDDGPPAADADAPETRTRIPFKPGRNRTTAALAAAAAVAVAAVALVLALQGGGHPARDARIVNPASLKPLALCSGPACVNAYNPDGVGGTAQDNSQAPLAVDGNPGTAWTTQTYYDHTLNKPGVGIYVSTAQETRAVRMTVDTITPGWAGTIYATDSTPDPNPGGMTDSHWVKVGSASNVHSSEQFALNLGGHSYRHYLVWITALPATDNYVSVNEIKLYR